jgi:hypothetical protein
MSKMVTKYDVNGTTVDTIKEVSELVGHKVTKKEVLEGLVEGVTAYEIDDEPATTTEEVIDQAVISGEITPEVAEDLRVDAEASEDTDTDTDEDTDTDDSGDTEDEDSGDETQDTLPPTNGKSTGDKLADLKAKLKEIADRKKATEPATSKKGAKGKGETEEVEYPEKGYFKTEKDLKKFYKKLTDAQLDEWLELEGLTDKVKLCDHEAINRMRKCMTIMDYHFPKDTGAGKKKSKYADYSTEELVQMAIDNDIVVKDDRGNPAILRMYCIMALRENGILQ